MSSEIRVNKINNRAGLGTVTYTDTGIIVSGVSTASNFKTGTSDLHSAGLNVAYADVDDFVDVGNIIKLGNAGVVTATTFSTSNVDVTTDKIVVGTGVTIEANGVDITGGLTVSGITTFSDNDIFFKNSGITSCKFDSNVGRFYFNGRGGLEWYKNGNLSSSSGAMIFYSEFANQYKGLVIHAPWQGQNNAKNVTVMGSSNGRFYVQNNLNAQETFSAYFEGGVHLGYYQSGNKLSTTTKGITVGTGVTIETNGQATYTGIVTASSFKLSDGSAVGGVESDAQENTVAGTSAGASFNGTDAEDNTLYGYRAGASITSGDENTFLGHEAGYYNSTASYNTAIGSGAGKSKTTGHSNVNIGYVSDTAHNASFNTSVGAYALENSPSNGNTAMGQSVFRSLGLGAENNTGLGRLAGQYVSTGAENTILGAFAARIGPSNSGNLTTGSNNIIVGYNAQPSGGTVSNEITLGNTNIDKLRVPGLGLEFAKDHTYGVVGGRKNWFDNGSFDCIGGRRAATSMDYGNHHAYGWVTDRFQSRNSVQWTRSTNVPTGKGFSYSTQTNGAGGRLVQAVELPDYGDMGVFSPGSYWCVSLWSTAAVNQSGQAFSYDLGSTKTDIPIVTPSSGGVYLSSGETASGTSSGTFTRYYAVFQMPNSIISTATSAYWTWAFHAAGYHTGWQLERVPTATSKPTPYEHVHPSVTIARCRRYCYQNVNSRLINGYKRHDSNIHWAVQFPVPPTHMPAGSNQSVVPYGITLHDGGLLSNFQTVLQNPGVNSVSLSEFDYRSGRFLIVGSTSWSSTHTTAPAWESQEYEIQHGHF